MVLKLTLNTDYKLAGSSVPGLVIHFVSDNIWSFLKVCVWLLAH